ncbi:MAG TPA: ABC transporter permease [Candidatus Microsaccharimonas sp.]|nr:ABC transporter permease [Candidatus Microsaccharimonas sp.]
MIASIRSELRKLLSVRSTYVFVLCSLAIVALFAGYGDGYQAKAPDLQSPLWLQHESFMAVIFVGLITAIVGLLLFGHEYRFNGIMYTLTASNNRLKSLFAKVLVVSIFAIGTSLLYMLWSPLCSMVGIHLAHHTLSPQTFHWWNVIWRSVFVGWGYAMYAFILVAIIRSQVGAIVAFLMIPLIGENILANVFKSTAKYLPFQSLQSVIQTEIGPGSSSLHHNVMVTLVYVIGGLLISAILFVRRDAN